MSSTISLSPLQLGRHTPKHRIFIPSLMHMRAHERNTPGDLVAQYYSKRDFEGDLIVAAVTQINTQAQGYLFTPRLNAYGRAIFHGGDAAGYVGYPALGEPS